MKKIFLIVSLLISLIGFSQSVVQRSNGLNTLNDPRWESTVNLFIPRYFDTTAANANKGIDSAGAIIYTYIDKAFWIRQHSPKKWSQVVGSSSNTSITNIYNSSITGATISGNCIYINLGSGSNLDTVCSVTLSAINSFQFLSDTSLEVCGYILPDTLTEVCDTLTFSNPNSATLYLFDNGLKQVIKGHVEFGSNPLTHNTTLNTGYFKMNFSGQTVNDYPYQFYQNQYFQNGTAIVSFLSHGYGIAPSYIPISARLGINFTGDNYNNVAPNNVGYYNNRIGYWIGTNAQGYSSNGLRVDDNRSKNVGVFFDTYDSTNTDAISFFGTPQGLATSSILPIGTLYNYKILTLSTDKSTTAHGYGSGSSFITSDTANKPAAFDANGKLVRLDRWPGSGGTSGVTTTDNNIKVVSSTIVNTNKQFYDNGNVTGAVSVDMSNGFNQKMTATGDVSLSFSNLQDGSYFTLRFFQDGTGSHTLTVPSAGLVSINLSANDSTVLTMLYDSARSAYIWTTSVLTSINNNANVGTGNRWLIYNSQQIKTAFGSNTILIDSVSNSNGLTFKADTSTLATQYDLTQVSPSITSTYVVYGTGTGIAGTSDFKRTGTGIVVIQGTTESYLQLPTATSAGGYISSIDSSLKLWANGVARVLVRGSDGALITGTIGSPVAGTWAFQNIGRFYSGAIGYFADSLYVIGYQVFNNKGRWDGQSSAWSATTPGQGFGAIHLSPVNSNGQGAAITFGASGRSDAQAGIYTTTSTGYGTRMYLGTTDNFSTGAQTALALLESGAIQFPRVSSTAVADTTTWKIAALDASGNLRRSSWVGGGGLTSFTPYNGLTKVGTDSLKLGGNLTAPTTIGGGSSNTLTITGSSTGSNTLYVTNTSSGTGIGIDATSGAGLNAFSTSGTAVLGSSSSSLGGYFSSGTNTGLQAQSSSGIASVHKVDNASTNTQLEVIRIERDANAVTAANGIGGYISYFLEDNGGTTEAGRLIYKLTDVTHATPTSQFIVTGVNSGTTGDIIYFEGDKRTRFNGRAEFLKGADVASAGDLTLGADGNVFHITGTTTINAIITANWQAGSEIILIFDASVTVKNNTSGGAGTAVMHLSGAADFSATASDVLRLVYDGTAFYEVSRSAN